MLSPRIKPGHLPVLPPDGSIWIGPNIFGLASEVVDESGLMWPLCRLLDGTRSAEGVVAWMGAEYGAEESEVRELLDFMWGHGWLTEARAALPHGLDDVDVERHKRTLEFLTDIEETPRSNPYWLLERLRGSSVAVLGVGGVGSAVAASLAATGVGRLHLLDGDLVEPSNLNRQLLFTEADIGTSKVDALAARLGGLDSRLAITTEHRVITGPEDVAKAIAGADLVFSCADRPAEILNWVNEACFDVDTPWMTAAYYGALTTTTTVIPGETCCYSCISSPQRAQKKARGQLMEELLDPDFHPVIAASAQIAGNQLALDGIRLLTGMPVQTAGREVYRNLLDVTHFFEFVGEPLPDCPVGCGRLLGESQP